MTAQFHDWEIEGQWQMALLPPDASAAEGIALVRWPEERGSVDSLRASGRPRLLLVPPGEVPPVDLDADEDWIRLPATDEDLQARATALARRSIGPSRTAITVMDGQLRANGQWVPLSPIEEMIVDSLVERFGELVPLEQLAIGPNGHTMTANAIRVHMMRLRKRIQPLGLAVRTVHGRGYLIERV